MRFRGALLVSLLALAPLAPARAERVAFSGILEVRASVGTSPYDFELLSVAVAGMAEVDAGVVKIPASELSAAVPGVSGFGGTLVNGPATFSAGGAGPGSTCPLIGTQEICIDGGGFGGVMALAGVTHEGQALAVWGLGGANAGSTASGLPRIEQGTRWTEGNASAWYYIFEIDATPFAITAAGTFRGLPGTHTATGPAGFSLVTPMVVTANLGSSTKNVRAMANLRVDFDVQPAPIGGAGIIATLLVLAGLARSRRRHTTARPAPA